MRGSVFGRTLRDAARGFCWWSIALAVYTVSFEAAWPTAKGNPALTMLPEAYPQLLKALVSFGDDFDFGTPAGYLGRRIFSIAAPLLLASAAVAAGSWATAGEEERGTLDLLLAQPLSRQRLLLERLAALVVEVAGLGAVLWLSLWAAARAASMSISGANLAAATGSGVLLALAFGALALFVGAVTGRRVLAIGAAASLALASYLVNSLALVVGALKPIRPLSLYYHYAAGDPLRHGLEAGHVAVLVAVFLCASAAAALAFTRRDLA